MKRLWVLVLLAVVLGLVPDAALGCSCSAESFAEKAQKADAVAQVRVKRLEYDGTHQQMVYTVLPQKVWKGNFVAAFLLRTSLKKDLCGLPGYRQNQDLIVLARGSGYEFETSSCDGTQGFEQSLADQLDSVFGSGKAPTLDPNIPAGEPPLEGIKTDYTQAYLVGGALFFGLMFVVVKLFLSGRKSANAARILSDERRSRARNEDL